MAVTTETLRVVERLRRQLTAMTDAQTNALTRAWVEAWDVLLPEFELALTELLTNAGDTIPRGVVARNARLSKALQAARAMLDELAPASRDIISADVQQAVFDAVDGHALVIQSQLPPNVAGVTVDFNRVSADAMAAMVERTTQQIHASTKPLPADIVRQMKRDLVRGIVVGDNPRKTAARMVKQAEGRFNGGLTRALVISRTETLDAHRAATKASEKANKDILAEWEWHARLDARTCPSCLVQHGSRHPLNEHGPLDHQQGRCARVSITKSWKELGFDIEEPKSLTPDAREWFDGLTPETQAEILGPAKLKLLQDGDITWEQLSTRRQTDGWRDSYGVTPLKNLTGG